MGPSSVQLLAANPDRLYAEVKNYTTQPIWLGKGIPAVVGEGTRLLPGTVRMFTDNELYLGQINAITQGSPVTVDVEEGV